MFFPSQYECVGHFFSLSPPSVMAAKGYNVTKKKSISESTLNKREDKHAIVTSISGSDEGGAAGYTAECVVRCSPPFNGTYDVIIILAQDNRVVERTLILAPCDPTDPPNYVKKTTFVQGDSDSSNPFEALVCQDYTVELDPAVHDADSIALFNDYMSAYLPELSEIDPDRGTRHFKETMAQMTSALEKAKALVPHT